MLLINLTLVDILEEVECRPQPRCLYHHLLPKYPLAPSYFLLWIIGSSQYILSAHGVGDRYHKRYKRLLTADVLICGGQMRLIRVYRSSIPDPSQVCTHPGIDSLGELCFVSVRRNDEARLRRLGLTGQDKQQIMGFFWCIFARETFRSSRSQSVTVPGGAQLLLVIWSQVITGIQYS